MRRHAQSTDKHGCACCIEQLIVSERMLTDETDRFGSRIDAHPKDDCGTAAVAAAVTMMTSPGQDRPPTTQ